MKQFITIYNLQQHCIFIFVTYSTVQKYFSYEYNIKSPFGLQKQHTYFVCKHVNTEDIFQSNIIQSDATSILLPCFPYSMNYCRAVSNLNFTRFLFPRKSKQRKSIMYTNIHNNLDHELILSHLDPKVWTSSKVPYKYHKENRKAKPQKQQQL